jgi:parvulin-like peptidyl-prolyl isomerase
LKAHPARYSEPAVLTFQQIVVDPAKHGASTEATLKRTRLALAAGADPAAISDSKMLPSRIDSVPLDLIARDFGDGFAAALSKVKLGDWEGPVRSGYGIHLVMVEKRVPGRMPSLDSVLTVVARDLEADRRAKSADAYYQKVRKDYDVVLKTKLPSASRP